MDNTPTARAGRREWLALGILALPTVVLSMDLSVLHLAAPNLSADLAPSGTQLLWILDVYGFLVAGFLLVMGALGDRIGRRRLLLIGAAAFAAASVFAAFAPTAELLIVARALLGIAGATLMPSTLALLAELFPVPSQRAFAIAVWMTAFTAGEAIGPLVGGVLLEFFWWGSVFLIGVPVMLVLLVAGPSLLPESETRLRGRFDLAGAMMLVAGVLAFVYGVKTVSLRGFGWDAAGWTAAGALVGLFFARRQLRSADPLMDLRLFRLPAFGAGLGAQLLAVAAIAGSQLLVLQYLQTVTGLSPLEAGLWTAPSIVLGVVATLVAPRLARRVRPAFVVGAGLAFAALGAAVIAVTATAQSPLWTVLGFTVLYTGVTPTLALITDLIVGAAPRERAGMASSVAETGAEFGLAGGIAFIGATGMAVYRARLAGDPPAGVAEGDLHDAGETAGNAIAIAEDLPGRAGDALLETVRASFADGVQVAASVCAVLVALGAGLAVVFLRGRPDSGSKRTDSDRYSRDHGRVA
ncbi:MFS transporter [Saccharomonospora sp. NPDC006951]